MKLPKQKNKNKIKEERKQMRKERQMIGHSKDDKGKIQANMGRYPRYPKWVLL